MGSFGASQSSSRESSLSIEQGKILKAREAQYQQYFFPELIQGLNDTKGNSVTTPLMASMAGEINQQSSQSKGAFSQAMAQRGMAGSGIEAQGIASLERARGSTFADAFFKAQQANLDQKNKMLQMGGSMSPTPTQAAPMESSSSGWNMGIIK